MKNTSGIALVKNIHEMLHEALGSKISELVKQITHHRVVSSHSDISTRTGEMMQIFILDTDLETELKQQTITQRGHFKLAT